MNTQSHSNGPFFEGHEKVTVTILGAGTMGAIIAYLCACAEHKVNLFDCSRSALEKTLSRLGEWSRRDFAPPPAAETVLQRVEAAPSLETALTGASIVIEALPENLELKQKIFAQLDTLCPPDVILASNSSSLRMSRIEIEVQDRGRVANMHFLHPPMKPVEIMAGSATLAHTLEQLRRFAISLGLRPFVLRQESTGFLFNRIWRAIKREVLHEVAEGVAAPEDIDRIAMLVWNWERGPFGWMDIVGLDVVRSIEDIYFEESGDTRDKAPDFLNGMIERGELGVKSGKGFYSYPNPAYEQAGWLTGECTQASDPQPEPSADSFIGTWRLISFQATAGNQLSYPMGEDAQGRLIYTRAGQMSVVLSRAQRPPLDSDDILAASMEEKAGAYDSCLSYFGAFELKNDTVVHHIEYCTFPNWVGSAQERFFHFDGNRLTLRTPPMTVQGATIVSTLVWERMEE